MKEVSFLYYTKNGVCKSNKDMPETGESFKGWLSAASVIRNQHRHSCADVKASKSALTRFLKEIDADCQIKETDLLQFV